MNTDGFLKHAIWVFVIVLAVYCLGYYAIEHRRTSNGPWQVAFTNDSAGVPVLLINQPKLAITNVLIAFPGESLSRQTNIPGQFAFEQPRPVPFEVPFGRCVFMDTTSLPGTLVFEISGHEIQLLPRVLTIDKTEQAWQTDLRLNLPQKQVPPEQRHP